MKISIKFAKYGTMKFIGNHGSYTEVANDKVFNTVEINL